MIYTIRKINKLLMKTLSQLFKPVQHYLAKAYQNFFKAIIKDSMIILLICFLMNFRKGKWHILLSFIFICSIL